MSLPRSDLGITIRWAVSTCPPNSSIAEATAPMLEPFEMIRIFCIALSTLLTLSARDSLSRPSTCRGGTGHMDFPLPGLARLAPLGLPRLGLLIALHGLVGQKLVGGTSVENLRTSFVPKLDDRVMTLVRFGLLGHHAVFRSTSRTSAALPTGGKIRWTMPGRSS